MEFTKDFSTSELNDEKYRLLFESVNFGIFILNSEFKPVELNKRVYEILGYSESELKEMTLLDILVKEELKTNPLRFDEINTKGYTINQRHLVRKDGNLIFAEITVRKLSDGSLFGLINDISERHRIELELKNSLNKLQNLIHNAPFGLLFYHLDPDGKLIFTGANPSADKILGVDHNKFIGKTIEEAFPPLAQTDIPKIYKKIALDGGTYSSDHINYEDELIKGAYEILAFQTIPNNMAVTFTDVTIKKRIEQEKAKLIAELELKNKDMEKLIYIASHDLRSPLLSIQGFIQKAEKYIDDLKQYSAYLHNIDPMKKQLFEELIEEKIPKAFKYINSSSLKMDTTINGLLKYSRTGRAPLNYITIPFNELVQNVITSMAYQVQTSNTRININSNHLCYCDPVLLHQAIENIIDNALKYRHIDRVPEITITTNIKNDNLLISISDNGIGIDENHLQKIFEIFQRLNPSGSVAGEGIGLAITKKIIEKHNGKIWVESKINEGSTFYISLPQNK